jgi:hypothetical protein
LINHLLSFLIILDRSTLDLSQKAEKGILDLSRVVCFVDVVVVVHPLPNNCGGGGEISLLEDLAS